MNYQKICRLCLDCNNLLLPIFEINLTDAEHPIALSNFLQSFLKDPIEDCDEYPQQLCVICLNQIRRFYEFKIKCDRASVQLRDFGSILIGNDATENPLKTILDRKGTVTQTLEPEYLPEEPIEEEPPHRQGLPVIPLSSLLKVVQFFKNSNMKSTSNLYKVVLGEKRIRRKKPIEVDAEGNVKVIPASQDEIAQSSKLCIDTPYSVDEHPLVDVELSNAPYSDHDYANLDPKAAFFKVRKKADIQPKVYAADESGRVDRRVCWPDYTGDKVKVSQAPIAPSQVVEPPELVPLAQPPTLTNNILLQDSDRMKCPAGDCDVMFYHSNDVLKHIIAAHTAEQECLICFAKDLRRISKHCRLHLPHIYTCPVCGKGFTSKMELKVHRERAVTEKLKCNPCNKLFCQPKEHKRHMKRHEIELQGAYKIRMCCAQEFLTKEEFTQHRAQDHVELLRACKSCPEKFRTLRELARHEAEVHPDAKAAKEYKCPDCPMTFTIKVALLAHSRLHKQKQEDDISRRRCDVCFNVFADIKKMQLHRKSHFQEPKVCKLCNRTFPNKVKYKNHVTHFHSDRRKYRCEACNKSFKYNGNLSSHKLSKHHKAMIKMLAATKSASSNPNASEVQNTSKDKEIETSGDEAIEPEVEY